MTLAASSGTEANRLAVSREMSGRSTHTIGVVGSFNIPQGVVHDRILVAGHFLLFICPFRKFDFVREQVAASQGVAQPKLSPQSAKTLPSLAVFVVTFVYFDEPVIVGIADEPSHAVCRNFILEVHVGHGGTIIVRVERFIGGNVPELHLHTRRHVSDRCLFPVDIWVAGVSSVGNAPVIVGITVWVECDLLLCIPISKCSGQIRQHSRPLPPG